MTKFWLALLLAIPLVPAFAEAGYNFDNVETSPGSYKWTPHYPRVQDIDGTWKNYIVSEDATKISIKSATAFLEYDKADCTYKIKDDANTLLPYVAWTAKRAHNGTDIWESMSVNAAQCSLEIDQQPEYVIITATKSLGDQKFEHELKISDKIKETVRIEHQQIPISTILVNQNGTQTTKNIYEYKLGAVQTIGGPEIIINGTSINLAENAGLFLDRDWIIDNKAMIFEVANNLNYDFDIGFNSLWGIKVYSDKVALDFNNATNDGAVYLEIDPTYTNTYSSTSIVDWVVPAGTTSATIKAWGAGGGGQPNEYTSGGQQSGWIHGGGGG
ncbi:MAG: hypothetical protein ACKO7N_03230, partial [Candidatus Nitrosotenuis sp.]